MSKMGHYLPALTSMATGRQRVTAVGNASGMQVDMFGSTVKAYCGLNDHGTWF